MAYHAMCFKNGYYVHCKIDVDHMEIPNWRNDLPTWEDQIMPNNLTMHLSRAHILILTWRTSLHNPTLKLQTTIKRAFGVAHCCLVKTWNGYFTSYPTSILARHYFMNLPQVLRSSLDGVINSDQGHKALGEISKCIWKVSYDHKYTH